MIDYTEHISYVPAMTNNSYSFDKRSGETLFNFSGCKNVVEKKRLNFYTSHV